MSISSFIDHHYRHFNAASLRDAAVGYRQFLDEGGLMMITLAGAMSTAELGLSLADMIRAGKVHAICCTGANLEEDLFNLVAHQHYERIPEWRNLTPEQEQALADRALARVTDTCIPEEHAFDKIERHLTPLWKAACAGGKRYFPHEYVYQLIDSGVLVGEYETDPEVSWLLAACERKLPLFVPGWEDSTMGNKFASKILTGEVDGSCMKSGLEYMAELARWYVNATMNCGVDELPLRADPTDAMALEDADRLVGFFQIGGGIAGDFPICVVPMIAFDLKRKVPEWGYFCQISDSTTSYGSYSGAIPSEKITWGKLRVGTPMYVIESDATIVAPLVFAYVLGL